MLDVTILFYTASLITDPFASNIRRMLLEVTKGEIPIVSVSQKPLDFGQNICIGEVGKSAYNLYKQILIGAKEAKTRYVACCEDDSVYTPDYFSYVPPDDAFAYNVNHLGVDSRVGFIFRNRMNMCMCRSTTELMVKTLEERYDIYPTPEDVKLPEHGFSEPGRHEEYFGFTPVKRIGFKTSSPCLTWNHRPSLGGVRKVLSNHKTHEIDQVWGNGKELWRQVHG